METVHPLQDFWNEKFHAFRELERYARQSTVTECQKVQEVHDTQLTF
ncbi:hypothetical protein [Streptococcus merionis]|uniref:Uncharacterized protein n=1 Tax=Streptococcus merionis TaxID=400065 RepID=A0A239T0A9_9STRE|nr:hypothetical protein [Streptococcus merionis]SNU90912.1 Uncharacterised protein [Streptococcus merionis]